MLTKGKSVYETQYKEVVTIYREDSGLTFNSVLTKDAKVSFHKKVLRVFTPDYISCERMLKAGFQPKNIATAFRIQAHYEAYQYTGIEKYNEIVLEALSKLVKPQAIWFCRKYDIPYSYDNLNSINDIYYEWFEEVLNELQDLVLDVLYHNDNMFYDGLMIYEKFRMKVRTRGFKVIEYHNALMRNHKEQFGTELGRYDLLGVSNGEDNTLDKMSVFLYNERERYNELLDCLERESKKWTIQERIVILSLLDNHQVMNKEIQDSLESLIDYKVDKSNISRLIDRTKTKAVNTLLDYFYFSFSSN